MDSLFRSFSQIWRGFVSLPASRRVSIVVISAAGLVCVWLLVFFVNQKTYSVLFSNLSMEDAGQIVSVLEGNGASYRVSPAGDSILVPTERVAELRLDLASKGLPQGGGVGFEIFDNKNFGATEFVQQLNYQRALQGELSRTVNSLDEIQSSRVHIVVPQKSLFTKDQAEPTASVILKLKPGRMLKASQVEGISHLVASSIEGLDPKDVMIVDSGGDILSQVEKGSDTIGMSGSQVEYRKNIEKTLADRVQSMLEKVVGAGKAVVRVSAELDFQVLEKTEEMYDAEEPVIRSLKRKSETSQAPARGGESTVATTGQGSQEYKLNHDKTEETINYEISRVVSKTVMPVGEVERLSVAVLVDGLYRKNDAGVEEYQPRSEEERTVFEDIVKKAIGFDGKRGDQVVVTSVPFKKVEPETQFAEEGFFTSNAPLLLLIMKYCILLFGLIVVVFFVLRPLMRALLASGRDQRSAPAQGASSMNARISEAYQPLEIGEGDFNEIIAVRDLASRDAQKFAELLRNWL